MYFTSLREQDEAISTLHDGPCWWNSNLHTSPCETPALPLCYCVGLISIYFETIEKQYKHYTKNLISLVMGSACLLCGRGRWGGAVKGGGVECNRTPHKGISQSVLIR